MKKRYTSYFIKTSDNQQYVIDSLFELDIATHELDRQLDGLISLEEPSDEVLGRLFSTIARFDAM